MERNCFHLSTLACSLLLLSSKCPIVRGYRSTAFGGKCHLNHFTAYVPEKDLGSLVSQVNGDISLTGFLGNGGMGVVFSAKQAEKFVCQPPFSATLEDILKQTPQRLKQNPQKCLRLKGQDGNEDEGVAGSEPGKTAVLADPAGASSLSECKLNCHHGSKTCPTKNGQPPFIVVENAGTDGGKWLRGGPGPSEIANVLNQIREGLRFMTEVRNPAFIHHDLKWGNVCVQPLIGMERQFAQELSKPCKSFVGNYKAKLIDFGATVEFVFHRNRTFGGSYVITMGYAPPEWMIGIPYTDPAWSFDTYSLGVMAIQALSNVKVEDMREHVKEMTKLLVCSSDELCIKMDLCTNDDEKCCSKTSEELPKKKGRKNAKYWFTCDVHRETFYAAEKDIDFSKNEKDFARFGGRNYTSFHRNFCTKYVVDRNPQEPTKRRMCMRMASLLHPNPRWRLRPSAYNFDAILGLVGNTTGCLAA
mmetsp:Transcript_1590/g.2667  ORF Transcript_1590/g.2667 Transcript_1590/m.2667 type:complete len:473 (+) Transcript_1590:63-1481(+)